MRRPRPHRLTGSARRRLAAMALGALTAALVVSAATRTVAASGLGLNVNLGVIGVGMEVPTLPPLFPTPTPPAPPTTSGATPGLPGNGSLPALCPPNCPNGSAGGGGGGNAAGATGGAHRVAIAPRRTSRTTNGTAAAPFGAPLGSGSSAISGLVPPQPGGLAISPPPPVEQLTPLAGISFGQAPYLWPLLIVLDVIAAAAVVFLVRRTWSTAPSGD